MRSSKSRSRSKSNRQRSIGNIINRVFDSSGPEGKVRGTPQQIIEKYLALARDAQLGNDRVAEQNFLQHAEHYTRMLGEAQAELQREQAARQAQMGQHGGGQPHHGGNGDGRHQQQNRDRYDQRQDRDDDGRDGGRAAADAPGDEEFPGELPAFLRAPAEEPRFADADDGPGLVETPEMRQPQANERRRPAEADAATPRGEGERERGPRPPRKPKPRRDEGDAPEGRDSDVKPAAE